MFDIRDFNKKENHSPNKCINEIIYSIVFDKKVTIPLYQLNSLLLYLIKDEVYLTSDSNYNCAFIHIPLKYHNINTILSTNIFINILNDKLEFRVLNAKIGKLPVPTNMALRIIKNNFPNLESQNNSILIPKKLDLNICNKNIMIKVNNILLVNNEVTVEIASDVIDIPHS